MSIRHRAQAPESPPMAFPPAQSQASQCLPAHTPPPVLPEHPRASKCRETDTLSARNSAQPCSYQKKGLEGQGHEVRKVRT